MVTYWQGIFFNHHAMLIVLMFCQPANALLPLLLFGQAE